MTHYTIDYAALERRPVRQRQVALVNVRQYMCRERFEKLREMMKGRIAVSLDWWHVALSFSGVEGFPVKALYYSYVVPYAPKPVPNKGQRTLNAVATRKATREGRDWSFWPKLRHEELGEVFERY